MYHRGLCRIHLYPHCDARKLEPRRPIHTHLRRWAFPAGGWPPSGRTNSGVGTTPAQREGTADQDDCYLRLRPWALFRLCALMQTEHQSPNMSRAVNLGIPRPVSTGAVLTGGRPPKTTLGCVQSIASPRVLEDPFVRPAGTGIDRPQNDACAVGEIIFSTAKWWAG